MIPPESGRFRSPQPRSAFAAVAIAALLILWESSALTQPSSLYSVVSGSNQANLSFSPQGILSWSNMTPNAYFLIQMKTQLDQTIWAPLARGTAATSVVSIKVHAFDLPPDMVFVPEGYFTIGDTLHDLGGIAIPPHSVYVSAFCMGKFEVSNEEERQVFQWALDNGKVALTSNSVVNTEGESQTLLELQEFGSMLSVSNNTFVINPGRTNHPCVYITWYGAAAYCSYLSQMKGLPSCYNLTNWSCDFSASGYRLPTEAEWEKAARGGWEGHRFPWSDVDTITWARANYKSSTNNAYDVNPAQGYNPAAGPGQPFTTAVGSFAPNGFGLYDMAGNVWEWCWDWAGRYPDSTQIDPVGLSSGIYRVFRGGSWMTTAERLTCAMRYLAADPGGGFSDIGLRVVRRAPQQ
jgi:formylglycine-generating enzyme required for sulfatase activity